MSATKKRCLLSSQFYERLEQFVALHTPEPNFHHISYWINISFRVGVACIDNKLINLNELLLNESPIDSIETRAVSIDKSTYDELNQFMGRRGRKIGVQMINFWLNLACEVGFDYILSKRVDLTGYLLGSDSSEWFLVNTRKNNVTILPVESTATNSEKKQTSTLRQKSIPPSPTSAPSEPQRRKVQSQTYDPSDYEKMMAEFG